MQNDQKPRIRITVERIRVTTIRTRSEKIYCEICHRELSDEEIFQDLRANEPRKVIEAEATASHTDKEKGESK